MGLVRTEYWATRELHGFLLKRARMPFVWGRNDCALFAADAIWSFTGEDIAAPFRALNARRTKDGIKRGRYTDEASAFELIQTMTGRDSVADAAAYCAELAGLEELPTPKLAQRGDLLVMEDDGRVIAGIVHLNGRHGLSVAADGLMKLPIASWRKAWRV